MKKKTMIKDKLIPETDKEETMNAYNMKYKLRE